MFKRIFIVGILLLGLIILVSNPDVAKVFGRPKIVDVLWGVHDLADRFIGSGESQGTEIVVEDDGITPEEFDETLSDFAQYSESVETYGPSILGPFTDFEFMSKAILIVAGFLVLVVVYKRGPLNVASSVVDSSGGLSRSNIPRLAKFGAILYVAWTVYSNGFSNTVEQNASLIPFLIVGTVIYVSRQRIMNSVRNIAVTLVGAFIALVLIMLFLGWFTGTLGGTELFLSSQLEQETGATGFLYDIGKIGFGFAGAGQAGIVVAFLILAMTLLFERVQPPRQQGGRQPRKKKKQPQGQQNNPNQGNQPDNQPNGGQRSRRRLNPFGRD